MVISRISALFKNENTQSSIPITRPPGKLHLDSETAASQQLRQEAKATAKSVGAQSANQFELLLFAVVYSSWCEDKRERAVPWQRRN